MEDNPANAMFRDRLAYALVHLGDVERLRGRMATAKSCFDRALSLKGPLISANPSNGLLNYARILAMRRHGLTVAAQGDLAVGATEVRQALEPAGPGRTSWPTRGRNTSPGRWNACAG